MYLVCGLASPGSSLASSRYPLGIVDLVWMETLLR